MRPLLGIPGDNLAAVWENVERKPGRGTLKAKAIKNVNKPFLANRANKLRGKKTTESVRSGDSSTLVKLLVELGRFISGAERETTLEATERIRFVVLQE